MSHQPPRPPEHPPATIDWRPPWWLWVNTTLLLLATLALAWLTLTHGVHELLVQLLALAMLGLLALTGSMRRTRVDEHGIETRSLFARRRIAWAGARLVHHRGWWPRSVLCGADTSLTLPTRSGSPTSDPLIPEVERWVLAHGAGVEGEAHPRADGIRFLVGGLGLTVAVIIGVVVLTIVGVPLSFWLFA